LKDAAANGPHFAQMSPLSDIYDHTEWAISTGYDPDLILGTGNVYGTPSVRTDVAADLTDDGAPMLAKGPDGTVYLTWTKVVDPTSGRSGEVVLVSQFDGTSWSEPVEIPGRLGLSSEAQLTFDAAGTPVLVWSFADPDAIQGTEEDGVTEAAYAEFLRSSNVVYSTFDGTDWSMPQVIVDTEGPDRGWVSGRNPAGQLVLAWVAAGDAHDALHVATWNGATWVTSPVAVATGEILGKPNLGPIDDSLHVFWTQDIDPRENKQERDIFSAAFDGVLRTAPLAFRPSLFVEQLALAAGVALADLQPSESASCSSLLEPLSATSFFGRPPSECCKCDKIDTVYQGTDQNCGFTVEYDQENCKKIITYKPCAPPGDLNDILGPVGHGEENWIPADQQLDYMIRFENAPVFAQAPAQKVVVTQQRDGDRMRWPRGALITAADDAPVPRAAADFGPGGGGRGRRRQ
jgi:hypothetical protein